MTPSVVAGRALYLIEHPNTDPSTWDAVDHDVRDWYVTRAQPIADAVAMAARAEAWDQGMSDMAKLMKAGPGYEMGNPYRKAAA